MLQVSPSPIRQAPSGSKKGSNERVRKIRSPFYQLTPPTKTLPLHQTMNRPTTNQAPRTPPGNREDNGHFLLRLHGLRLEAQLSFVSGWKSLISKKMIFDLSTFRTLQGQEFLQVESSFAPATIIILIVQKDVIYIELIAKIKCAKRNGYFTTRRH